MSKKAEKSIDEMYRDLMFQGATFGDPRGFASSEDEEDFMTSKEIVEAKQKDPEDKRFDSIIKGPVTIEEDVHFKIYNQRREHKYTETEMKQIRESCKATIVHDYGEFDIYHISDEERRKNDALAELSLKLGMLKRTYRQVDQYVEAMRIVIQAWRILERQNFIHDQDEFYQMVADGKIVSNRIIMPKLKNANQYNMDMIIKYISNPDADPSALVPISSDGTKDRFYDRIVDDFEDDPEYQEIMDAVLNRLAEEDDPENPGQKKDITSFEVLAEAESEVLDEMEKREMQRLLSPEDVAYIQSHKDDPDRIQVRQIPRKEITGYDRRDGWQKKKRKKLSKKDRYSREFLHKMLNKIQDLENRTAGTSSFMVTHGMFEVDKEQKSPFDDFFYEGSWADEDAVALDDIRIREALLQQHIPGDVYRTYADQQMQTFFKVLEENGVNTVDLRQRMQYTDDSINSEIEKRRAKDYKKLESALMQRLIQLNGDKKFKKTISKAEEELQKHYEDY